MDNFNTITEKTHPIETKWIIKNFIIGSFWSVSVIVFFAFVFPRLVVVELYVVIIFLLIPFGAIPITFSIISMLARKNYHYEFGEKFITFKQGIISKSERHVLYGRIQNVYLSQSLINRLLGLTSISIETASEGAGAKDIQNEVNFANALLGFISNKIRIPGLLNKNALELRDVLMELIKKNPIDDAQSGL